MKDVHLLKVESFDCYGETRTCADNVANIFSIILSNISVFTVQTINYYSIIWKHRQVRLSIPTTSFTIYSASLLTLIQVI